MLKHSPHLIAKKNPKNQTNKKRKYQKLNLKDSCCKISNTILQTQEIKIQMLLMKSYCLDVSENIYS